MAALAAATPGIQLVRPRDAYTWPSEVLQHEAADARAGVNDA